MKQSKIISVFALMLMLVFSSAYAQKGPDRIEKMKDRFEKQTERLTKGLSLTADQVTKIKDINTKTLDEVKALKEKFVKENADKSDKRDEVKAIMESRIKKIEDVLTAEQKEKFKQFQEKMKEKRD